MGIIEARFVQFEAERELFLKTLQQFLTTHPSATFTDVLESMENDRGGFARSIVIVKHNLTKEQAFIVHSMGDYEAWRNWLLHCFRSYCKQNNIQVQGETCLK